VFFSIVERQALRRGDFASVTDLIAAISRFCAAWNQRCQRFFLDQVSRRDPHQAQPSLEGALTDKPCLAL
jgi:hypothetical protein